MREHELLTGLQQKKIYAQLDLISSSDFVEEKTA